MTISSHPPDHKRRAISVGALSLMLCGFFTDPTRAQALGVTTQGVTGGLVIPTADVLSTGTAALTYGNYQEPQLGSHSTKQNMSFGLGLLPHVELFGRFANYTNPVPDSILFSGVRDISANAKLQLPTPWTRGPKVALGINDISGGAVFFKSAYLVASEQYGPLSVSLGYARGGSSNANSQPTFDGAFGGAAWRFGNSGLSALAEHDGQQKHAGLRWQSDPLDWLGQVQLVGTLQQSFGAATTAGTPGNARSFALSLLIPFGKSEERAVDYRADREQVLPLIDTKQGSGSTQPSADERLTSLRKVLIAAGLERVRVGMRDESPSTVLVIDYENHRYGRNEADALGLVLGFGAEMAPPGTQRVVAVTFKEGLRLYETSVGVAVYRAFLRDGPATRVRDSLSWERLPPDLAAQTRWIDPEPSYFSRVRVEIKPDLNYTLGTEFGAFDYSLAANVQAIAPLWSGARLYTSYILPLTTSPNMEVGGLYEISHQRKGLKTAVVQQSFWLGKQVLSNVAVGRFYYGTPGVQAEAAAFVPNSDDLLRLRGAAYREAPGGLAGEDRALSASYRRMLTPTMWAEVGLQRYSNGSSGPSLEWTRWFGDVGVQLFYRKGGERQFAGLQLSFPITPRQGMAPGPVIFTGASQFSQAIRTQLTTARQAANLVEPTAVRDIRLETSLDVDQLNAGRLSRLYFAGQIYRMREIFLAYCSETRIP